MLTLSSYLKKNIIKYFNYLLTCNLNSKYFSLIFKKYYGVIFINLIHIKKNSIKFYTNFNLCKQNLYFQTMSEITLQSTLKLIQRHSNNFKWLITLYLEPTKLTQSLWQFLRNFMSNCKMLNYIPWALNRKLFVFYISLV